jgi:putative nucleotidyltransferase with HDIG domain
MEHILTHPVFKLIAEVAHKRQQRCFVIGGFVRDHFLQRTSKDADIVVLGDGIELAQEVSMLYKGKKEVAVFKNFGTAQVKTTDWEFEFVGARKESYSRDSRKPQVEPGTLEDDQRRRDFTINALAIGLTGGEYGVLSDPFGGIQDIEDKIIRTPLDPDITFSDDPLRMMRAIRFASQLNFTIHADTLASIARNAERLDIISAERITDELNKIILSATPSIGFKLLFDTKLLHRFFPELAAMQGVETINGKSHKDNFYHTLQVLDQICELTDDLWLRWAAILHDIAKPLTKRFEPEGFTFHGHEDKGARMVKHIFKRLKLPLNEKMNFVEKMVMLHLRPKALAESPQSTDSGFRRLIVDAGEEADALFTLCYADITSKNQNKVALYRGNLAAVRDRMKAVEERDDLRNWQPPIDGMDIMKTFGIGPGREIGIIKNYIREAILEGDIGNTKEDAWQLMLAKGQELGLNVKII